MKNCKKKYPHLKWHVLALALIVLAGIISYSNSIDNSFHFDDEHSIVENISIRSLNPQKIWKSNNHFRFVGFYSFALNYHFNRLNNIRGWHYVNIGVHILCAIVLYFLLFLIAESIKLPARQISLTGALLFAVHPICSEPVNYIQARHVLFYSLFTLSGALSAMCFLRTKTLKGKIFAALAMTVSIFFGSFSKEVGIFYVPAAIGLCFITFSFKNIKNNIRFIAFIAAVIVFVLLTSRIRPLGHLFGKSYNAMIGERTFISNLLTYIEIYWRYISLIVPLSSSLNVDHHVPIVEITTLWQIIKALIPLLGIVFLFICAFKIKRKNPIFFFMLNWSLIGFLPYMLASGGSAEMMVEYKMYLSTAGLMGFFAWFFVWIFNRFRNTEFVKYKKYIYFIVLSLPVIFCINETRARNQIWKDDFCLWSDAVKKSPEKARPYYNLGLANDNKGNLKEAMSYYQKVMELAPYFYKAKNNLGVVLLKLKKSKEAVSLFQEVIKINPRYADAHNNMGIVMLYKKNYEQAVNYFLKALEVDSNYYGAHNNLGIICFQQGKLQESVHHYKEALKLNPYLNETYCALGAVLEKQGKADEAIKQYHKAIALKPDSAAAYFRLGNLLYSQRKYDEAIANYMQLLRLDPYFIEGRYNLAGTFYRTGKIADAIQQYRKVVQLKPEFVPGYIKLSWVLATCSDSKLRDTKKAVQLAEHACKLTKHKNIKALDTLAAAYASAGKFDKAVKTAQDAIVLAKENGKSAEKIIERLNLYRKNKAYIEKER